MALKGLRHSFFLISPDLVQSEMCNKEIAHAKENNKRIIPIVIRDANPDKFIFEISRDEIKKKKLGFLPRSTG